MPAGCLLGLVLALLLLVLGDAALWDGWPGPVVANIEQAECPEKVANPSYPAMCSRAAAEHTRCGSFCFYAECVRCVER